MVDNKGIVGLSVIGCVFVGGIAYATLAHTPTSFVECIFDGINRTANLSELKAHMAALKMPCGEKFSLNVPIKLTGSAVFDRNSEVIPTKFIATIENPSLSHVILSYKIHMAFQEDTIEGLQNGEYVWPRSDRSNCDDRPSGS